MTSLPTTVSLKTGKPYYFSSNMHLPSATVKELGDRIRDAPIIGV